VLSCSKLDSITLSVRGLCRFRYFSDLVQAEPYLSRAERIRRDVMDTVHRPEDEANLPSILEELTPQSPDTTNRDATELTINHSAATNTSSSTKSQYQGRFGPVKKFWRSHVSLRVPHINCRDHLGMLTSSQFADFDESNRGVAANERTFLAWIRTSIALSMLGAVIAQLFRLQSSPSPPGVISLYVLSVPLACICQGAALITALAGGHRYWRQQNAMARGQSLASGWEFWLIIGILGSVSDPQPSSYSPFDGMFYLPQKRCSSSSLSLYLCSPKREMGPHELRCSSSSAHLTSELRDRRATPY
jgi:uncharacterized membrane protein YidH (DUF202 family)